MTKRIPRVVRVPLWLLVAVLLLLAQRVSAYTTADQALQLALDDNPCYAYRYVVDSSADFLVLCRYELIPLEQSDHTATFTGATVNAGGDVEALVLTNKVIRTATPLSTDLSAIATGPTDITSFCSLGSDLLTLTCTGTGLAPGVTDVTVTYRAGWNAYSSTSAIFSLVDAGGTAVSLRTVPQTGYALVGIYLTAAEYTASGLVWGDGAVLVSLDGNPSLWVSPGTATATLDYDASANHAATVTSLGNRVLIQIHQIEVSQGVTPGTYQVNSGITPAGQLIAVNAFSLITNVTPLIFQTTQYNPSVGYTPQPKTLVDQIAADAAASSVGQAWHGWYGTVIFFAGSVALGVWLSLMFGQFGAAAAGFSFACGWCLMLLGFLVGAVPYQMVFLSGAAIFSLALLRIVQKVYA